MYIDDNYSIADNTLETLNTFVDLGITFNKYLTFNDYFDTITSAAF